MSDGRTVGSLFSGCLGLDLGLEQAGWDTIWACENDGPCRDIIARRRPVLTVHPDVRELGDVPRPRLLAGGFPCQDLSQAGRGAGLDGARSGLWFAMADAVRNLEPELALIENVPGLATKMGGRPGESALGTVIADLAEAGYVGTWFRVRAADVGAPHLRERIFIVGQRAPAYPGSMAGAPTGERDSRSAESVVEGARRDAREEILGATGCAGDAPADPDGGRQQSVGKQESRGVERPHGGDPDGRGALREFDGGEATHPAGPRLEGQEPEERLELPAWGAYEPAIRRWEHILGRTAPQPTDDRGRLMPEFVEWMLGFPDGWTEGVSRTQRLRMLGNSVQVQVAEAIGHYLQELA